MQVWLLFWLFASRLCCRPDGSDLYLISSHLLHIFDQTMSMLPFATRTDMIEALKRADAKISEVNSFLDTLLAEHDAAGARAQLKTLGIAHVRAVLQVDDEGSAEKCFGPDCCFRKKVQCIYLHVLSVLLHSWFGFRSVPRWDPWCCTMELH